VKDDALSDAPTKREKRRAREAAKKAKEGTQQLKCNVCGEKFSSKTKLFAHIDEEGHAIAPIETAGGDQGRKRGKKRK